jgi:hypothetical protein
MMIKGIKSSLVKLILAQYKTINNLLIIKRKLWSNQIISNVLI